MSFTMFFKGVAPCVSIIFVFTRHAFVHALKRKEQQLALSISMLLKNVTHFCGKFHRFIVQIRIVQKSTEQQKPLSEPVKCGAMEVSIVRCPTSTF